MKIQRNFSMILLAALIISSIPLIAHENDKKMTNAEKVMTLPSIWQEIKEKEQALEETIKAGKFDQVQKIAFSIRDQAKLLLEKTMERPEMPVGVLAVHVNEVETIADLLGEYGDAKEKENIQEQFNRLKRLLSAIEKQYPAGMLYGYEEMLK